MLQWRVWMRMNTHRSWRTLKFDFSGLTFCIQFSCIVCLYSNSNHPVSFSSEFKPLPVSELSVFSPHNDLILTSPSPVFDSFVGTETKAAIAEQYTPKTSFIATYSLPRKQMILLIFYIRFWVFGALISWRYLCAFYSLAYKLVRDVETVGNSLFRVARIKAEWRERPRKWWWWDFDFFK